MKKKKVVIVGGGLAGLSAAHELLKKHQHIDLTLVEALDRVGGRVYTPLVDEVPVDVGGFMVFPFYREFRDILKEFGLHKALRSINSRELYRLTGQDWINDRSVSIFDLMPRKFIFKILRTWVSRKIHYYEPNLDLFPGLTTYELLVETGVPPKTIELYETLLAAYTYPSLKEMPAALLIPLGVQLLIHGLFNRCKVLEGGTSRLVNALAQAITARGGKILLSSPVTHIRDQHVVLENHTEIPFDDLIIASQIVSELIIPPQRAEPTYTHYDFVVAALTAPAELNANKHWFIGYQTPEDTALEEEAFASFAQMSSFTALPDEYVGGWLLWPEGETPGSIEEVEIASRAQIEKAFAGNHVKKIAHVHRWRLTMPEIQIETIRKFRSLQGKHGIWFAGDYLGFPSMDMAVYSGKQAAKKILKKYQR